MMYDMGHLFAWHLYLESKPIFADKDFISSLGIPKRYKFAVEDVWSLIEILKPIKNSVMENSKNLIYEAGITFVCARNIAICSSPDLVKKYTFSIKAPLEQGLKMSDVEFSKLVGCRYASTRGITPPKLTKEEFVSYYETILNWSSNQLKNLENSCYENN